MDVKKMLSYEEYDRKMTSYEAAVKRLGAKFHTLGPTHPLRLHLKQLVAELKSLPEEVLTIYLQERHKNLFDQKGEEAVIYKR